MPVFNLTLGTDYISCHCGSRSVPIAPRPRRPAVIVHDALGLPDRIVDCASHADGLVRAARAFMGLID
jgi:hypothetical protein